MNQPLGLWPRSIIRVSSSCHARSLLPAVQRRAASNHYWAKSNSTHIKQARREKVKSVTGLDARHSRFQNDAEYREATSILRRYLLTGSKNGVFSGNINSALTLLSWMMDKGNKNNHENFMTMCDELSLDTGQVMVFARVLLRTRWPEFKKMGSNMINYAAEAGDPTAACFVVGWALEKKDFSTSVIRTSLRRVEELAENDRIPQAMALQGLLYLRNGEIENAEKLLDEATKVGQTKSKHEKMEQFLEQNTENYHDPSGPWNFHPGDMARYCHELAKIRAMNEDADGVVEAYRRAAFVWDDPLSFTQLARWEEKYSAKWLECSIKAASAGDEESAYNLGMMYSMPREDVLEKIKDESVRIEILNSLRANPSANKWTKFLGLRDKSDQSRFNWAIEWFEVAMKKGHLNSMWENSQLFWQVGQMGQPYAYQDAILCLVSLGSIRNNSSDRLPRLKQQAEEQLRVWLKTGEGKKALRDLESRGVPIPSGVKGLAIT